MNSLPNMLKASSALCDCIKTADEIAKAWRDSSQVNHFSLYTRLALSLLSVGEVNAIINEAKLENLEAIKITECLLRGINIPIQLCKEAKKGSQGGLSGYFNFFVNGVIEPFAGLTKAVAEYQMYNEQRFIDMTEDERSKATRSHYEERPCNTRGDTRMQYIGEKPVNLEECIKNLADATKAYYISAAIKLAGETYYIISDTQTPIVQVVRQAPQVITVIQRQIVRETIKEFDDLLELSSIPPFLHSDPILSRFTCLISQQPIRHPVGDPNGITLYEKNAIYQWLENHNTSPMTRQPLEIDQLVERPALQALIDDRLTFLQTMIEDKIKECEQEPSDAQLQSDAELENPHY